MITPDNNSPSKEYKNGILSMKSGYAYSFNWHPTINTVSGKTTAPVDMYTAIQNGYAMFPEFNYSNVFGEYRTLQLTSGVFSFKTNTAAGGERMYYIPVWYPNGNYTVNAFAYDCCTPAGMIAIRTNSNPLNITGSLFDDYYIGLVS